MVGNEVGASTAPNVVRAASTLVVGSRSFPSLTFSPELKGKI